MPPFIPTKRRASTPPSEVRSSKKGRTSLLQTLDKSPASGSVQENKAFLAGLEGAASDTSLSDVGSSEFENVETARIPRKGTHDREDEEEVDWEDAMGAGVSSAKAAHDSTGDLELTLDAGNKGLSFTHGDKKKGPSKIERQIRISTHCMHVQFLMFHNLMRNAWTCDKEVQQILVGQLSATIKAEVETWRRHSGLLKDSGARKAQGSSEGSHAFGEGQSRRGKDTNRKQAQRDWGNTADDLERGEPNLSRGDPIKRLLKELAKFWKKRFTVTAPSLRKQGYKPPAALEEELQAFQNNKHDPLEHGEKIDGLKDFRRLARKCEGSRDVGVQLFTALVRGLGIEARMVASLQPVGFGWNKGEEATMTKKKASKRSQARATSGGSNPESDDDESVRMLVKGSTANRKIPNGKVKAKTAKGLALKKSKISVKQDLIGLSDDSELSSAAEDGRDSDNGSVIDVTPAAKANRSHANYDTDMTFPTYWVEVISPINHRVYPVDPFILMPSVAENADQLGAFEPRGAKAEKAKIVFAYVIGFSSDGTAKDVTTRYLKRHMWPGKTKGARLPVEKIPVLNRRGKVKRYEDYDWFKTIMSPYTRTHNMRKACDDLEEQNELKPVKPAKKVIKEGEETLQSYKQSAEFVLERFLRREEALRPGSVPVKTFATGKGEKATEEPVYRRKDVMVCRTSESWHKEGRQVKPGEYPMKMVPVRAVTLMRKREVEDAERDTGEKLKQGMYAIDQTEYIIPPPIENGRIPKNAYGNMDCFVPSMVPRGAVHIPLRSTMKICKRLGIDYAEAVTGFEFGNKRAVPVIMGVVVAAEHENLVIDEWEKDETERKIKEEGKREKMALGMWRKLLMGLRIVERVRDEYGADEGDRIREEVNPFTNRKKQERSEETTEVDGVLVDGNRDEDAAEELAGRFFVEEDEEPTAQNGAPDSDTRHTEDQAEEAEGGFMIEEPTVEADRDNPSMAILNGFKFTSGDHDSDVSDSNKDKSEETTDSEIKAVKKTNRQSRKPSKASPKILKATPQKAAAKRTSPQKAKAITRATTSQQDSSSLSSQPSASDQSSDQDSPPPKPARNPSRTTKTPVKAIKNPTRKLPTRTSARKSETALKSQYFESSGEDDGEEDEDEDRIGAEESGEDEESEKDVYQPKARGKRVVGRVGKAKKGEVNGGSGKKGRGRPRKTL